MCLDRAKLFQGTLISISLLLSACDEGSGTATAVSTPTPAAVITSMGTDFYLTLPDHLCVSKPASCNNKPVTNKLIMAASTATTGEVTFNGVITPFSIAAGGETVITLDPAVVLTTNETVEIKGIHVTALSPVSVHVVSENATSADGYMALPTPGLGTKYYVMSYATSKYSGSEFAVVATQNATTISITPSAAGATKPAGTAFTVLLNIGETYQFANPTTADLTGTLVTADPLQCSADIVVVKCRQPLATVTILSSNSLTCLYGAKLTILCRSVVVRAIRCVSLPLRTARPLPRYQQV